MGWDAFCRRAGAWATWAVRAVACAGFLIAGAPIASAQPREREIEAAALYMPNLGAQPGQRLKTRNTIGCFRQAANDYRCIILGLRMQGAMVTASRVEAGAQSYLDRYCRGRTAGLDYQECRFQVAFDYVSETFDADASMRVYRAENLALDSTYVRNERTPPNRSEAAPVQDGRVTGSIETGPKHPSRRQSLLSTRSTMRLKRSSDDGRGRRRS